MTDGDRLTNRVGTSLTPRVGISESDAVPEPFGSLYIRVGMTKESISGVS